VSSWYSADEVYCGDDDEDESDKFLIKAFGCTKDGQSVAVNLLNFTPHFYIKIQHKVDSRFSQHLHEYLITYLPAHLRAAFIGVKIMKRKDFWGFTNFQLFPFARLTFKSSKAMNAAIRIFQKDVKIVGYTPGAVRYKLYESNIEPLLRFMHIQNVLPTGWVKIPAEKYDKNYDILKATCDIDINCNWKAIVPVEGIDNIAPFKVASFDIECTSSHGDFPMAKKNYQKVVTQLFDAAVYQKQPREVLQDELIAIFTPGGGKFLSRVFPKHPPNVSAITDLVTKNMDDIMNILGGRIKYKDGTKPTKETIVRSLVTKFDKIFPALEGDPIIQIGTTVHKYGDQACYYRAIVTLGSCAPIEGVDVIACDTEAELLLAWRDLVHKIDPDMMIGYNIFGFDFAYLKERAEELGVERSFSMLGRIAGKSCEWKMKQLSSSALGDNMLKFYETEGRVLFDVMKVIQRDHKLDSFKLDNVAHHFIGLNKHDVHPSDIFRLQKGSDADRRVIAEYCIQDCALCNQLTMKLEIVANNVGMSNVCSVPLTYIFMRGQGIKIFSLVAKECKSEEFLIPSLAKIATDIPEDVDDDGYEGAIVLDPKCGIYIDDPICVLDYASLYPASMISENLSHDCIVIDKTYDNLPGYEYLDITYDIYQKVADKKQKVGERVCRFAQLPNNEKGIIPRILMKLLRQRKETRKKAEWKMITYEDGTVTRGVPPNPDLKVAKIEDAYDSFQKAVLDGLQLAYKVTANSLYGQIGSRMSAIYLKDIAACTTATGRKMIMLAKDYIEKNNEGAEIVYGDTDSLFIKFTAKDATGNIIKGKPAIPLIRELGIKNSTEISKILKPPHDLEWEKIFYPFILLSKKRYVANKYEYDDHKFKQASMGIVLKRRDNANIVKKIYGGIIDIILNKQDVKESIEFLKQSLEDLVEGKNPLEDLVVTKSLRADYKDPEKIAHKVLADRIKERDPGNAPNVNDRIPYIYIVTPATKKTTLQGERIETPEYIKANGIKPDYEFYITNQIMNPVLQVYELVLEQIEGYRKTPEHWAQTYQKILKDRQAREDRQARQDREAHEEDVKKAQEKLQEVREAEVKHLLFDAILNKLKNRRQGLRPITDFFAPI
jgi:DNA polymerase elongation subunit (family B)